MVLTTRMSRLYLYDALIPTFGKRFNRFLEKPSLNFM